jgi:hypothetical protein
MKNEIQKPSALITGGNKGIGIDIYNFYQPQSKSLSRTNGFDIRLPEVRAQIAEMSLKYDIFFNHAYARDNSQTLLLKEVYQLWRSNNKPGYIFSTGTYGTYSSAGIDPEYIQLKSELDLIHKEMVQKLKFEKLNFRMTLLRLGLLDTEKSRQKPHWPGFALKGIDVAMFSQYLYEMPSSLLLADAVFEAKSGG